MKPLASKLALACLLTGAAALSGVVPAIAQGFPDPIGQEHIDRGVMDRNRRSRGQTRTLWGDSERNSADSPSSSEADAHQSDARSARRFATRLNGSDSIILLIGVDVLADGSIVPKGPNTEDVAFLADGLEVVPTGRSVGDLVVPVRVPSTGQEGWLFLSQLTFAD